MNRIGDWEGDTIIGKGRGGALLTMVERKTLYTVIVRLTGKRSDLLAEAAVSHMVSIKDKIKTITFDNVILPINNGHTTKRLVVPQTPQG
ncbi:hypothetical protein GL2_00130 [Microbulbifer sp. GL-2]|nr:hypothetical protein GL2_00130 [Microbulbifer sp. GL-2]